MSVAFTGVDGADSDSSACMHELMTTDRSSPCVLQDYSPQIDILSDCSSQVSDGDAAALFNEATDASAESDALSEHANDRLRVGFNSGGGHRRFRFAGRPTSSSICKANPLNTTCNHSEVGGNSESQTTVGRNDMFNFDGYSYSMKNGGFRKTSDTQCDTTLGGFIHNDSKRAPPLIVYIPSDDKTCSVIDHLIIVSDDSSDENYASQDIDAMTQTEARNQASRPLEEVAPQFLRSEPQLLRSEPQLLRPEPQLLRSEPRLLRSERQLLRSEPQMLPLEPQLLRSEPQLLRSERQLLRSETQMLPLEPQLLRSERQLLRSETQLLQSETQLLRSEPQLLRSESQPVNERVQGATPLFCSLKRKESCFENNDIVVKAHKSDVTLDQYKVSHLTSPCRVTLKDVFKHGEETLKGLKLESSFFQLSPQKLAVSTNDEVLISDENIYESQVNTSNPKSPFRGFDLDVWIDSRKRWLNRRRLLCLADNECGSVSEEDSSLFRLRLAALSHALDRSYADIAFRAQRCQLPYECSEGQQISGIPYISHTTEGVVEEKFKKSQQGESSSIPTYVALLPQPERLCFKAGFLQSLNLSKPRRVCSSAGNRSLRHRLRKRKLPTDSKSVDSLVCASIAKRRPSLINSRFAVKSIAPSEPAETRIGTAITDNSQRDDRYVSLSHMVEVDGLLGEFTFAGERSPPMLTALQRADHVDGQTSPPSSPPALLPQLWRRSRLALCPVCGKYIARALMRLHRRVHRTGYLGCDVCGEVYERPAALYRHRLDHDSRLRCQQCATLFETESKLARHCVSVHGGPKRPSVPAVSRPSTRHLSPRTSCNSRLGSPAAVPAVDSAPETCLAADSAARLSPPRSVNGGHHGVLSSKSVCGISTAVDASCVPMNDCSGRVGRNLRMLVCDICDRKFTLPLHYIMHRKLVHAGPAASRGSALRDMCRNSVENGSHKPFTVL